MMKATIKILISFVFLFLQFFDAEAQIGTYSIKNKKAIKNFEEGLRLYQYKQPLKAKPFLLDAVKAESDFFEANILLGDVLQDLKEYDEAIKYYQIALRIEPEKIPRYYNNMANTMLLAGRYEEAIAPLNKFLSYPNQNPDLIKLAQFRLACAEFSTEAVKNPLDFKPINMGENINSMYDEYYPALTVDNKEFYFTRRRKADELSMTSSGFEEDFYLSRLEQNEWTKAYPLGAPLNTHYNEGVQSISPDGRTIIFTACDKEDSYGSCDLYIAFKSGGKWQKPTNMGSNINSKKWESQPTVSPDGNTIIFTSNRTTGIGKADLWTSNKDKDGKWLPATNLSPLINTEGDENSPFIHPDGNSLYFSSTGLPGLGGFDLFRSIKQVDGSWGKPENLGYPINTKEAERHLIINPEGNFGFISANYEGGFGGIDIYQFTIPDHLRPQSVTYIKGTIKSKKNQTPQGAFYELIDLETGKVVTRGYADPVTGEYLSGIPVSGKFAFNAQMDGFLFHSENFTLNKTSTSGKFFTIDILLKSIEKGEAIVLNNIFFETASAALLPESKSELSVLVDLMKKNKSLKIEIGGHTDDVGSDESNVILSRQRAQSVVNHLLEYGIMPERLTSKGYGAKNPIADNKTEEGKAKNRRTEFKIIEN